MKKTVTLKMFTMAVMAVLTLCLVCPTAFAARSAGSEQAKPNILVIMADDIGPWNVSYVNQGMMGYKTPNIDRIAKEGMHFTDYYADQSCTAGRAAFITGQSPIRTGLTKVGFPSASIGLQKEDPTLAEGSSLCKRARVTRPSSSIEHGALRRIRLAQRRQAQDKHRAKRRAL